MTSSGIASVLLTPVSFNDFFPFKKKKIRPQKQLKKSIEMQFNK